MSTTTDIAQPDANHDIAEMTVEQIQREMAAYAPTAAPAVAHGEQHREGHKALWARLDELSGVRKRWCYPRPCAVKAFQAARESM